MRKGEGGVEVDGQMGKGEEMVVELEVSAPNSVAKIFHWKTRCLRLLPPPVASTPMATTRSVDAFGYHPPLRSAPYHYPLATTPPHHPPGSTIGGGCASLREWITSGNLAGRRHHDISARVFSDSADRIWRDVLLNKELNLTSYYVSCFRQKFQSEAHISCS
ncbi:hypothetical protein OsJ_30586 [Oryza sativa Japonica Group]|uniref:Uncharacterized protein n=1 Tax=Oryza sativa subsp. japonica TaxID=39947 RepID=B9G7B5_ORYSJ|nr:hypothetical protein OsJ_30586 [Oryza sativa Japonica Group]